MFQLFITSHGNLCEELVKSGEVIAGDIEGVETLGLHAGDDLNQYKEKVKSIIEQLSKKGHVLVLTDLMYGTPFNSVSELMDQYEFEHISGINMPIFLEIVVARKFSELDDVVESATAMFATSIVHVNALLEGEGLQ